MVASTRSTCTCLGQFTLAGFALHLGQRIPEVDVALGHISQVLVIGTLLARMRRRSARSTNAWSGNPGRWSN